MMLDSEVLKQIREDFGEPITHLRLLGGSVVVYNESKEKRYKIVEKQKQDIGDDNDGI